jgi:hypothetical protein
MFREAEIRRAAQDLPEAVAQAETTGRSRLAMRSI